jgi:hypothetical protein
VRRATSDSRSHDRIPSSISTMLSSDVKRAPQLPYDVLVKIFVLVGPKTYLPDNFLGAQVTYVRISDTPKPPPSHSFAFSQVCQDWRQAALATPTLWDVPLFHHSILGSLMLERAEPSSGPHTEEIMLDFRAAGIREELAPGLDVRTKTCLIS